MQNLDKGKIEKMAVKYSWEFLDWQPANDLLSFFKDGCRLNIWLRRGTVGTALNHPKRGKTQLFRKNCDIDYVRTIMINPRQHTGKGYYEKK